MTDGIARFKDFTGDAEPIQFKIHDEVFTAFEDIPLKHMGKLADIGGDLQAGDGTAAINRLLRLFEKLLVPESYARFQAAVNGESTTSIGISRIKAIIPWLMEQYGLRPTEASSGSGDTLSESGASSTDGAQPVESISESSTPSEDSTSLSTG